MSPFGLMRINAMVVSFTSVLSVVSIFQIKQSRTNGMELDFAVNFIFLNKIFVFERLELVFGVNSPNLLKKHRNFGGKMTPPLNF